MKIAILNRHPTDTLGGSEIQCDLIASHLRAFGHDVTFLAAPPNRIHYANLTYEVLPLRNLGFREALAVLRRLRPDVLYWRFNRRGSLPFVLACRLLGIRFVYAMSHINDATFWTLERSRYTSPRAVLSAIRNGTHLLAPYFLANGIVSQVAGTEELFPFIKKKTSIRNSMSTRREAFSWPRPYVIWVANLKPRKNAEAFLELADRLPDLGVDFLMIGKIQDRSYHYMETASLSRSNFHFLGPKRLEEVNGILESSLFLVHTCDPEGFPNNLIQAWLQGKPTITLYYDPNGFIESNRLGFLSRTPENLIQHTLELTRNADIRQEFGNNALAFAKQHFDPAVNIRKLEGFLREVVA